MRRFEGLNILLLDDDAGHLSTMEDFLEAEGHVIEKATRGWEAVDIARRRQRENRSFELSILDYHVPDLDGLRTFEELSRLLPDMGAIFISGNSPACLEDWVLAAGGFALFEKPLDLNRMRQTIEAFRFRLT